MRHILKTLGGIGGILLSFPLCAHPFYVGLKTGISLGNSQMKTRYFGRNASDSNALSGRSLVGGIVMGGGGYLGKVYLGLEGESVYQHLESNARQRGAALTNNFFRLLLKQSFGVSGRIGLKTSRSTLLYLKIGSTWGRWSGFSRNHTFNIGQDIASHSLFRPGISGGIGVESSFCSCPSSKHGQWIWGGEFTYTGYSSFHVENTPSIGFTSFTPRLSTFTVHIKRTF